MNDYPPEIHPPPLPPEPATRRIHQYGIMIGLAVLVIVFTIWLAYSYQVKQDQARQSTAAAHKLCRQLTNVGQPCATLPPNSGEQGVSGDAAMPAPTASLEGSAVAPSRKPGDPLPTDEDGIPQAFQPGDNALIVSVHVSEGRLILTFDDGARIDAGPVNEETLAIVLTALATISPSPSPSPVLSSPPPGADAPDPAPTGASPTPQESPT